MLGIIYFSFVVILGIVIVFQFRTGKINSMLAINLFMLVYYAIPLYVFTSSSDFSRLVLFAPSSTGLICIFIFYLSSIIGYKTYRVKIDYEYYIPNEKTFVFRTALFIMIFSAVLFLLYCSLFGGFSFVMLNISSIRSGDVEIGNAKLDFLTKLYPVVIYAPVLLVPFWKKSLLGENGIKRLYIIMSVIIAFTIRISTGSRGAFLTLFLILALGSILSNLNSSRHGPFTKASKNNTRNYILMTIIAFFAIVILRPLLLYLNNLALYGQAYASDLLVTQLFSADGRYSINSTKDIFGSLLMSFSHYANTIELALLKVSSGEHENNYFMEFVAMLQSIIPSKLLGLTKMHSVTYYNSAYFGSEANIPPGIIGSAIYSGGMLWIVLYGYLVGYVGKRIDIFYARIKRNVTFASYYYGALWFLFFFFAASGDFASQFGKSFTSLLLFLYIYMNLKRKKKSYVTNFNV